MGDLRWAPPSRDDDSDWAALLAAIEVVDERGETYELQDLDDEWKSVWSHPETDAIFVWDERELVAFAWLKAMPGQREANRVWCWGGVRPSHRRRGIGTQVFDWMLRRASEVATGFDADLETRVQLDVAEHQVELATLAAKTGFDAVRRFLEIARPTGDPVPEVPAVEGLELVPWSAELDEETRLAQVDAFADHWGSEPRSAEEWAQWYTGHRSFRPDLSMIAVDPATGQVASLVLSSAFPQDWGDVPVEAWISTVGTRRAWRRKGVARWVLADVLRKIAAADTDFERTILGVDAENPTGALRVYRDLGFAQDVRVVTTLSRPPLRP